MNNKWILGILFTGIFANIVILYWLYYDLSDQVRQPVVASATGTSREDEVVIEESSVDIGCQNCEDRLVTLEQSISVVNDKVAVLEDEVGDIPTPATNRTVVTQQSIKSPVKEVTVALGSGMTKPGEKGWLDIPGMNAYVNTANYARIAEARFEATLRVPQGYVHARLYNKTDDHPVWHSEVVSETDTPILKQSNPIALDAGNKLYQVQLKSTIGAMSYIDSGRIKILLQ